MLSSNFKIEGTAVLAEISFLLPFACITTNAVTYFLLYLIFDPRTRNFVIIDSRKEQKKVISMHVMFECFKFPLFLSFFKCVTKIRNVCKCGISEEIKNTETTMEQEKKAYRNGRKAKMHELLFFLARKSAHLLA